MSHSSIDQQRRWLASQSRPDEGLLRRYQQAQLRAGLAALAARLGGRSTALPSLEDLLAGRTPRGVRAAGLRSVPIAAIVASEGRHGDFDRRFRPLRADSWDRWRSVASAMLRDVVLPPVELLAMGDCYAVRDGHHRISAAALLGQGEVDALVTLLEL